MNNITKEEKERIYGLYVGNEVKCGKLPGWIYSQKVMRYDMRFYTEYSDRGLTLLLTPLPEITDEDAIEVAKITDAVGGSNLLVDRRKEHLLIYHRINDTVYTSNPKDCVYFYPEPFEVFYQNDNGDIQDTDMCRIYFIIQFLISRGYSVPLFFGIDHWANGMDAIQLGIGIAKTKEG